MAPNTMGNRETREQRGGNLGGNQGVEQNQTGKRTSENEETDRKERDVRQEEP